MSIYRLTMKIKEFSNIYKNKSYSYTPAAIPIHLYKRPKKDAVINSNTDYRRLRNALNKDT